MKTFLLALALLALPTLASAASQTITIEYNQNNDLWWSFFGATPSVQGPAGAIGFAKLQASSKRVTDALLTLQATDGKRYTCKATAFLSTSDSVIGYTVSVTSLSAKSCIALN